MQPHRYLQIALFSLALMAWSCSNKQYSQNSTESDDMYFASTDRQKVLYDDVQASSNSSGNSSANQNPDNYSTKNVNPEYLKYYRDQSRKKVEQEQKGEENADSYSSEYYDPNIAASKNSSKYSNYNNNYSNYGNSYGGYSNYNNNWGYNSYNPYGSGMWGGYGYSPWSSWGPSYYSPRSSFWLSFGMGSSWGYPYNNWYGGGFYNSYWGSPYGYYNPWNSYNSGFYSGYYYGSNYYGSNSYYNNNYDRGQQGVKYINRGVRDSRGAGFTNSNGAAAPSNGGSRNINRGPMVNTPSDNSNMRTTNDTPERYRGRVGRDMESYRNNRPTTTDNNGGNERVYSPNNNTSNSAEYSRSRPSTNNGNSESFNSRPTSRPSVSPRSDRGGYSNGSSSDNSNRSTNYYNNNNNSFSSPGRSSGGSESRSSSPSYSSPSSSSPSQGGGGRSSGGGGSRGIGR